MYIAALEFTFARSRVCPRNRNRNPCPDLLLSALFLSLSVSLTQNVKLKIFFFFFLSSVLFSRKGKKGVSFGEISHLVNDETRMMDGLNYRV